MTRLGSSTVSVPAFGLGGAPMGNVFHAIDDASAAVALSAAWHAGVRYYDTAPHYGLGLSERRLASLFAHYERDEFLVSTKVGRLLVDNPEREWDFSAKGIWQSIDESMSRLGLDWIDIVLIDDPQDSPAPERALTEAYPVLDELREAGVVGAIGVGSKDVATLTRFAEETDVDALMVAGRYTLLEQPALDDVLPACQRNGISVINAGVYNSGLLADDWPDETRTYDYRPVPPDVLSRAQAIATVCREHDVALPHAALAFARSHPAVVSVVVGSGQAGHIRRAVELFTEAPPPDALWTELVERGLLRPQAQPR